jgi:dTDP-4-amino-4,6-dideoxy-D-galactose acyltransferase
MPDADCCKLLDWDSEFFGRRIARLSQGVLTCELLSAMERHVARERLDCVYFLAEPDQRQSLDLAQASGFRLVDTRITLDVRVLPAPTTPAHDPVVRRATAEDACALRAIARVSHRDSRFYHDTGFSPDRCDALYEAWIENSLHGWADVVFVSDWEGQVAGYITCSRQPDGVGQIGLLGVDRRAQGLGHGTRLVLSALAWFSQAGCAGATVVTQARNAAAQRLYQKCGFAVCRTQLWFHRWFEQPRD